MMAGANGHPALVQYGADVVRMHPFEGEADDSGAVRRSEDTDAVERGKGLASLADQRRLVRRDRLEPDPLDIAYRRLEAENADDMGGAGLEAGR